MPSSDRVATAFTAESLRHRVTVGFALIGRLELIEIHSLAPQTAHTSVVEGSNPYSTAYVESLRCHTAAGQGPD